MRRRDFITVLGGAAAAWPLSARAQQPAMPVVGFLHAGNERTRAVASFEKGLAEGGYVADRNVAVELRWADSQFDRLPALAAELVSRNVAVIAAFGNAAARAAKAATTTIPIAFASSSDPVAVGFVSSLTRPGWNLTGVTILNQELEFDAPRAPRAGCPARDHHRFPGQSRERDSRPQAARDGERSPHVQSAPAGVQGAQRKRVRSGLPCRRAAAARRDAGHLGHHVLQRERGAGARGRRACGATMGAYRDFTRAGGLMSYGSDLGDAYRRVGICAARLLKGQAPSDLPVMQSTKVEFVINVGAAKVLGLAIPPTQLALADEVIE